MALHGHGPRDKRTSHNTHNTHGPEIGNDLAGVEPVPQSALADLEGPFPRKGTAPDIDILASRGAQRRMNSITPAILDAELANAGLENIPKNEQQARVAAVQGVSLADLQDSRRFAVEQRGMSPGPETIVISDFDIVRENARDMGADPTYEQILSGLQAASADDRIKPEHVAARLAGVDVPGPDGADLSQLDKFKPQSFDVGELNVGDAGSYNIEDFDDAMKMGEKQRDNINDQIKTFNAIEVEENNLIAQISGLQETFSQSQESISTWEKELRHHGRQYDEKTLQNIERDIASAQKKGMEARSKIVESSTQLRFAQERLAAQAATINSMRNPRDVMAGSLRDGTRGIGSGRAGVDTAFKKASQLPGFAEEYDNALIDFENFGDEEAKFLAVQKVINDFAGRDGGEAMIQDAFRASSQNVLDSLQGVGRRGREIESTQPGQSPEEQGYNESVIAAYGDLEGTEDSQSAALASEVAQAVSSPAFGRKLLDENNLSEAQLPVAAAQLIAMKNRPEPGLTMGQIIGSIKSLSDEAAAILGEIIRANTAPSFRAAVEGAEVEARRREEERSQAEKDILFRSRQVQIGP